MAGLGFWQLERHAERTEYNALVTAQWDSEPLNLNVDDLPADVAALEYRQISADGRFDFESQIGLKNQFFGEQPGIQLLTPLVLEESGDGPAQAVLVARGWVSHQDSEPAEWPRFDEPSITSIMGLAQETQVLEGGTLPAADERLWHRANIAQINERMPYELLPFFIYQLPEAGRTFDDVPVRIKRHPMTHLRSPLMHTSYAIQWFSFALIFGFGYTQLVRIQERKAARKQNEEGNDSGTALAEEMMTV